MRSITKNILLLCLVAVAASCGGGEQIDDPVKVPDEYKSELINVEIAAVAEAFGDLSFGWQGSDKITLLYKQSGESEYTLPQFTYNTAKFGGQVWSWEGEKSLYAIYSRGEDITNLNIDDNSVEIGSDLLSDGNISFATSPLTAREAGVMVAKVDGALAKSAGNYSIPTIEFKQVASLLQLKFSDDLEEDTNVVSVEIKPQSGQFVSSADISLTTGEVSSTLQTASSIANEVSGGESTSGKYLTIPLLPTNTKIGSIIFIANGIEDKDGWKWRYTYADVDQEVERNSTTEIDDLSWGDLSQEIIASVSNAIDLAALAGSGETPAGDTWVIKAEVEEEAVALTNLSTILSSGNAAEASVTVELPGVTSIPENTFSGAIAEAPENDNASLKAVVLEDVTDVGTGAFKGNLSVKEVVLGKSDESGENVTLNEAVFENCTALESCQIKTEELPKATFKGCYSLKQVSLDGVKRLGESSFEECGSLFTEDSGVVVADAMGRSLSRTSSGVELVFTSVTEIGSRAFWGCYQFDVIRLNEDSDVVLTAIADDAFSDTSNITLYVSGAMKDCVDMKLNTLTVGATILTFKNILVDGVDDGVGSTGEDADVETM